MATLQRSIDGKKKRNGAGARGLRCQEVLFKNQ